MALAERAADWVRRRLRGNKARFVADFPPRRLLRAAASSPLELLLRPPHLRVPPVSQKSGGA
eukprot:15447305-Alexandrium_andersonii.AAC.1